MIETRVRPPLCNTGANYLHWDWYQATVPGGSDALTRANAVMGVLGAGLRGDNVGCQPWKVCAGLHGYSRGAELEGVERGSVKVFYGLTGDVHVQGTSKAAQVVADLLRQWWPDHRVSRADVALDVDQVGSFERLWRLVHRLAREGADGGGRKISTSTAGDWIDAEAGRTFYAGGRTSRLLVRVYEKGHEQRGKDPDCGASLDWTRVEWQLRPTSDQKGWLAKASPVEALGLSPFGALVAREVLVEDVVAAGSVLRFASQDPLYWMVRQYRRAVVGLVQLDPDDLRAQLVEMLDRIGSCQDCCADGPSGADGSG